MSSVITNIALALYCATFRDSVSKNVVSLNIDEQNLIKVESNKRGRPALSHNFRTFSKNHYEYRDKVLYKRKMVKGHSVLQG